MSIALKEVYVDGFIYSGSGIDGTNKDGIGSASQMPSWNNPLYEPTDFVWWDENNSPGPYNNGSAFFQGNCEIPTHTDSVTTLRVEHSITSVNHHLFATAEYVWWSISFYTPIDYVNDPNYDVITQWHQTGSSPAISIRRVNGRFRFEIITESGWTYQQVFDVGPVVYGGWTNFIVFTKWSDELNGILTVWRDGSLARLHHPVTGDPWVVPSELSEGVTTNWIIKELLGTLPYTIEEGGSEVSLFDWRGRTSREGGGVMPGKYLKCGVYKSSITGSYIDGNGLRPGWDDPGSQYYIPPESRVPRIGIGNVNIETRVNENTHENIYRSLDVNRSAPVEFPEWWIESEPINIVHPLNGQSFEVGSEINITTDSESGPVELIVKNNLVQIKELSPFNFSIQDVSNNDSLLDIPFDGNTFEWSSNDYLISVINPDDVSYENSPKGQAIILGSTGLVNNRSYISIDNTGPIESIENEFTISFYIKSNYGSGLNPIVLSNNNGSNGSGISINGISNGTLEARLFEENESSVNHRISISSLLDPEEYNHYTLTYDGSVIRWYYNFNFVNESNVGLLNISASKDWYINAAANQGGRQNIFISNLRIYNYAIPEEEINKTVEDNYLGQLELKVRRLGVESEPITINIVEELPTFTITATATTGGQVSGDGEYEENEEVTLTATPDSGYEFVRWEEDSETVSTDNPYMFNAEGDRVLLAVFELIPSEEYTISVTSTSGGNATGGGVYEEDDPVTLTATPDSGYEFLGWEEDSSIVSTNNPYVFNAEEDRSLLAVFELILPEEFTISVTSTTGGNATGGGIYEEDDEVSLTATPDFGYGFVGWEENESIVSTSNPYVFNAEEDRSLLAVFQQIEYQLTVTYTAGGTATGSGEYIAGSQVQLTATPNSGYSFVGWYRDSEMISTSNPYNYTTRGQADTVQAVFELIPIPEFTITVIPSMGGSVSGGGTYEEGQSVTLSAMPQSGWTFVKWSNEATDNPYSFTASENLTISAIFEEVNPEVPYIIVKGKFKIV